jgi:DNA polymerase/3'-5' exonuclease PolX
MSRFTGKEAQRVADAIVSQYQQAGIYLFVAGSLRRGCREVGDIDLVALVGGKLKSLKTLPRLASLRFVRGGAEYHRYEYDIKRGKTIGIDIWAANENTLGGMLLFATGPADYNIFLRQQAKKRGFHLNQLGLWRGGKHIALTEDEIQVALKVPMLNQWERNQWKRNNHHYETKAVAS